MHISKIEIENIKSYAASTFNFTRGTTAITGENGAGKTTIIEVIAWLLFDLLEYKKEDFLRRGTKKGWARVTFESGLDEREYVVYRDTAAGYNVTDPRLDTRIADKKEEVVRFLWQHLGLEAGTDLRSLFRQAIGVPQGTFTAIFLEGATERKVAFDRLLKVEEYRQAAEKLRDTSRFLDLSIGSVREKIARVEGELSRSDRVEEEYKTFVEQTATLSAEFETIGLDLAAKQTNVAEMDAREQKYASLKSSLDQTNSAKEKAELMIGQLEQSVASASIATEKVDAARPMAERHNITLGLLKELERERGQRDRLRNELAKTDAALVNVKAEQKRTADEIDAIEKAHTEIRDLQPKAVEQETAERELAELRDRAAAIRAASAHVKNIDERLDRLRESYKTNAEQLADAVARSQPAAGLTSLERRDADLLRKLADLRARLDRDETFQSEIKNGLCPILSQKCLNLKEGETLESFVSSQFHELRTQIAVAESEYVLLTSDLRAARDARTFSAALEGYRQREVEIKEEGQRLRDEKTVLQKQVDGQSDAGMRFNQLEATLKVLDDPRSRIRFLSGRLERETDLRQNMTAVQSNLERLGNDRQIKIEELESYRDLDKNFADLTAEREATSAAHREFLSNESEAKMLAERQEQLGASRVEHAGHAAKAAALALEVAEAAANYDAGAHKTAKLSLLNAERDLVQTRTKLDAAKQRKDQLAAELAHFSEIRQSLAAEFKEKERLENVAEATVFIRNTLKEAAPRVARNYVYHVSLEANQMFREISGNAERTLKWGEDYAILLEEDGYERPFQSLSGGEQMAAALSVRLALLKQLTDIRVAFFDEPTTNMDAERRENLAMQISRITHFDQLFVISHDDTFDNYVDNVISVGN